jgi:hypothetical protein
MMFAGMSPCLFLFLVLSILNIIGTLAFSTSATNDTHMVANDHVFENAVQLQILPLGAFIVYGLKSSDGNGFRAALRKKLIDNGNPTVDYIGSNHCGTMTDNECEGWTGYTISQVSQKAKSRYRPSQTWSCFTSVRTTLSRILTFSMQAIVSGA